MLEFLDGFSLVCILMYQSPRLCAARGALQVTLNLELK